MSGKCVAISFCLSFLAISTAILVFGIFFDTFLIGDNNENGGSTLILYPEEISEQDYTVKCSISELAMGTPSIQSFIRATAKSEDQQLLLNGLAVYSNLANACQPLEDVSKAKIQVHKVAFVTLTNINFKLCPFKNLIVSAQNAGYSVVIYFADNEPDNIRLTKEELPEDKILIPALYAYIHSSCMQIEGSINTATFSLASLANSDQRAVKIRVPPRYSAGLEKMQLYLSNLYLWFFVGPIITLEWLRRTKKFCRMSGGQQNETNENHNREEAANSNESLSHGTDDVRQPLLTPANSTEYKTIPRYVKNIVKLFPFKLALVFFYVIFIVAALPVGISSGGWSFFRFDEDNGKRPTSYLSNLYDRYDIRCLVVQYRISTLWSPIQVFCFFMYSRFACKTTWTVQAKFSKLIRSDWFASNVYLLVLGIVVPYCSAPNVFYYYLTYNTVCTISNGLFIIILNKHKYVTRYVFYISVCMIFAYLESDVVAVFYFALNSEGSLSNLKLTALRTAAIGLTLSISFSSSMHIIRKLVKPEESLFESLSEK